MSGGSYLPFRGLSAWFSRSVSQVVIQQWDFYGGILLGEGEADYLFGDDSLSHDTIRVYETQNDIAVIQSSWILEILQRQCLVHDVPLGQHLLQPHHLNPQESMKSIKQSKVSSNCSLVVSSSGVQEKRSTDEVVFDQIETFPDNLNPVPLKSGCNIYADYKDTWETLEARVTAENIEEVKHLDDIKFDNSSVAMTVCDFVCTQPGFKVQRIA